MSAEPIRIAHLITGLDPGGAEIMLFRLLSRLNRTRFLPAVFSLTTRGVTGDKIDGLGVPVAAMKMGGLGTIQCLYRLITSIRAFGPDIVQTWLYHADFVGVILKGVVRAPRLCWSLRCAELRAGDVSRRTLALVRVLARLSRIPDVVMVNSRAGLEAHERVGYHPRRWELLHNGFDTDAFRPDPEARAIVRKDLGLPSDMPIIGMVARFDPMKGYDNFLQAAAVLSAEAPHIRFMLVGRNVDSANRTLLSSIHSLGLTDRVILLGERDDVPQLLAALDVLVCASSGEGMPNVVGEAMACGVLCVATDVGDTALLLGPFGELVPPRHPHALAGACRRLLNLSPEERVQRGAMARKRVQSSFSLDAVVREYEQIYAKIAGQ